MNFTAFKQLVEERENMQRAFGPALAKSKNFDQLRHHMVLMLNCDQWGVDVVEFAEANDLVKLHELAEEINDAQLN